LNNTVFLLVLTRPASHWLEFMFSFCFLAKNRFLVFPQYLAAIPEECMRNLADNFEKNNHGGKAWGKPLAHAAETKREKHGSWKMNANEETRLGNTFGKILKS